MLINENISHYGYTLPTILYSRIFMFSPLVVHGCYLAEFLNFWMHSVTNYLFSGLLITINNSASLKDK